LKPPQRVSRARYARNLAVVAGAAIACGAIVIATYIVVQAIRLADQALYPPQLPLSKTPADVGLPYYANVTFQTQDGVQLSGWYVAPGSSAVPHTNSTGRVIVLAHGYASNREALLTEAGLLGGRGFGVLLFDFRGHGESQAARVTFGDRERQDLRAAVDFAAAQPGVTYIGSLGFSMGAATLAVEAADDPRLRAVALEAPFPTLEEEFRYRSRLFGPLSQWPALFELRRAGLKMDVVQPIRSLCAISPRPILLIYGTLDDLVPPGTAQAMGAAACPPAELWQVPGVGHGNYAQAVPEAYTARLLRLFGQ
jgi:dipeptidyl aminopeptidase/acylaminoacyl peptidase